MRAYDTNGAIVASFIYDSFGNFTASGNMVNLVKFRYHGYYYDAETGFYYLQNRYYDPTICRFISADKSSLLSTLANSIGELNLYVYCNNNPIMYTDSTGEGIFVTLFILGFFTILGGIGGGIYGYIQNGNKQKIPLPGEHHKHPGKKNKLSIISNF